MTLPAPVRSCNSWFGAALGAGSQRLFEEPREEEVEHQQMIRSQLGSALAFFSKRTNPKFLSFALGFFAGVMIYVSFTEILVKSRASLSKAIDSVRGSWLAVLSLGMEIASTSEPGV